MSLRSRRHSQFPVLSSLFPVLIVLLPLQSGCITTSKGEFALIASQVPEGIDRSEGVKVSGTSYASFVGPVIPPVFMFPVAGADDELDTVAAVRNALADAPGKNLLIDVEVSRYVAGVPGIFWRLGIRVTGLAVRYLPAPAEEAPAEETPAGKAPAKEASPDDPGSQAAPPADDASRD